MRSRTAIALTLVVAAAFVVGLAALIATSPEARPSVPQPKIIRGVGTATDGRVALTIDSYYYTTEARLRFSPPGVPNNTFLVVNLTFVNLGDEIVSVVPAFFVWVANGTTNVSNTVTLDPSPLPGRFPWPPREVPNTVVNIPPGGKVSGWLAFFLSVQPSDILHLRFLQLQYTYYVYGNLRNIAVRFLIAPR